MTFYSLDFFSFFTRVLPKAFFRSSSSHCRRVESSRWRDGWTRHAAAIDRWKFFLRKEKKSFIHFRVEKKKFYRSFFRFLLFVFMLISAIFHFYSPFLTFSFRRFATLKTVTRRYRLIEYQRKWTFDWICTRKSLKMRDV